jgi:hypothetical protein
LIVTARAGLGATTLIAVLFCFLAQPARADYIFTPMFGAAFGGRTAFLDLDGGAESTHLIFGGSAGWLSSGILGIEGDFAYAPRFFEHDGQVVLASSLVTLTGNVIVAAPLRVTGYSLRPYLIGGLGLIHSGITYQAPLDPIDDNSLGMNIGAGAIGLLSPRTGLRFELRHVRTFSSDINEATGESGARLSFWRATFGVLIRR